MIFCWPKWAGSWTNSLFLKNIWKPSTKFPILWLWIQFWERKSNKKFKLRTLNCWIAYLPKNQVIAMINSNEKGILTKICLKTSQDKSSSHIKRALLTTPFCIIHKITRPKIYMIAPKYINGLLIITKKKLIFCLQAFTKLDEKVPERHTLKIYPKIFIQKMKDPPQTAKISSIWYTNNNLH